jgi:hypothetical protein
MWGPFPPRVVWYSKLDCIGYTYLIYLPATQAVLAP